MTIPYLKNLEKGDHGQRSEKRIAKRLGAELQPASGAISGRKSDSILKGQWTFRIESKSTVQMTMPVELAWLTKISNESLSNNAIPVLTMSFVDATGKPRSARNAEWVAMPRWAFEELKEAAECRG